MPRDRCWGAGWGTPRHAVVGPRRGRRLWGVGQWSCVVEAPGDGGTGSGKRERLEQRLGDGRAGGEEEPPAGGLAGQELGGNPQAGTVKSSAHCFISCLFYIFKYMFNLKTFLIYTQRYFFTIFF